MQSKTSISYADGRIHATPGFPVTQPPASGLHTLDLTFGEALLFVPPTATIKPMPLIVYFHGAGGDAPQAVRYLGRDAEEMGFLLLSTKSQGPTWDGIRTGFGPDVATLNETLEDVFRQFPVDPARIAAAGFSDGASYALSLGIINGDLFREIFAFSPGFIIPGDHQPAGKPRIFISHGVRDRVLPIDRTSRRLAPALKQAGYEVDYHEFAGDHVARPDLAREALSRLVAGKG